ncbi:hypothetical protein FOZ63_001319 [Perkinsus olseni]|uniref:Uncharacterized protein n=1 Tax=Perkinsus olseni TaxID=32597 RepID=A0A7J6RSV0_PEROL|nr:hypothetical protein FOZ62_013701 [Perkinsus olseni]KAF4723471.1 hypothetical protein FOZ63_001319 [Perkinsus olseni]
MAQLFTTTPRLLTYMIHDNGGPSPAPSLGGTPSLIDYDMKARTVNKTLSFSSLRGALQLSRPMAAIAGHIFLGVEWRRRGYSKPVEVLHRGMEGNMTVIWRSYHQDVRLLGLDPVSASPLILDVIYTREGTCHSVRLEMRRLAGCIVFKEKSKEQESTHNE